MCSHDSHMTKHTHKGYYCDHHTHTHITVITWQSNDQTHLSVSMHSPVRGSHSLHVLSIAAVATIVLSKLNTALDISALWPTNVCWRLHHRRKGMIEREQELQEWTNFPLPTSQRITVWSNDPDTRLSPSELKASDITSPEWPWLYMHMYMYW